MYTKKPALHGHEFVQGDREIQNASLTGFSTIQCLEGIDTTDYLLLRIKHFMGERKKPGAVAGLVDYLKTLSNALSYCSLVSHIEAIPIILPMCRRKAFTPTSDRNM